MSTRHPGRTNAWVARNLGRRNDIKVKMRGAQLRLRHYQKRFEKLKMDLEALGYEDQTVCVTEGVAFSYDENYSVDGRFWADWGTLGDDIARVAHVYELAGQPGFFGLSINDYYFTKHRWPSREREEDRGAYIDHRWQGGCLIAMYFPKETALAAAEHWIVTGEVPTLEQFPIVPKEAREPVASPA